MKSKNLSCHLLILLAITSCGVDPSEDSSPQSAVEDSASPSASNPVSDEPNGSSEEDSEGNENDVSYNSEIYDSDSPEETYDGDDYETPEDTYDGDDYETPEDIDDGDEPDAEIDEEPSLDGAALYASYCASCHGSLAVSSKRGATAQQITSAIGNVGSMAGLSSLSSDEIQAISESLAD